jgi:hypothetical protein
MNVQLVILSREDGEGPVSSGATFAGYGSFGVCAPQDDRSPQEPRT